MNRVGECDACTMSVPKLCILVVRDYDRMCLEERCATCSIILDVGYLCNMMNCVNLKALPL